MGYRHEQEDRAPLPGAGYLEDYTGPFLVVAGVLCFIVLFALWAAWGLPVVIVLSVLADRLLLRR
jgi:hypothetical protein